jgi:N-acetylglucosamine-6-sulfatase
VTRRRLLTIGLGLVAVLVVAAFAVVEVRSDEEHRRPNFVVLMTDDQTLASMAVLTKTEQLIGDEGMTFSDNVVSFPVCCPSRATFLTGQYAHNHHVMGNRAPVGGYSSFKEQATTMPAALQRAGYDTIHVGKYLNGYGHDSLEVPPGWTDFRGSIDPSTYLYRDFSLNENGHIESFGRRASDYQTDVYARIAEDVITRRRRDDPPFLLNVAFLAPHAEAREGVTEDITAHAVPAPRHAGRFRDAPLPVPPSFDEADVSDKPDSISRRPRLSPAVIGAVTRTYRAGLETLLAVDDAVEGVIGALEDTGVLDDTYVIFTSDNGFFRGEHRIPDGKVLLYEPSIRVPLLVRGPGVSRGASRDALVANIDLAPTILDLAGVRPLRTMDGRSLVPDLTTERPGPHRTILLESGGPHAPVRGVRTDRYVYIEDPTGERELYDLDVDPDELDNRAADPAMAGVRADLARRLDALRACAGESCRAP